MDLNHETTENFRVSGFISDGKTVITGHDSKTNLPSFAKDRRLLRNNGRNQGQKRTGQAIFNDKDLGF
jgi:hypothetical protein